MSRVDEPILLYALRYAIGRQTFAPLDVQEAIARALPLRDAGVRDAMIREIEERVQMADSGTQANALGSPSIDAPGWRRLLEKLREQA